MIKKLWYNLTMSKGKIISVSLVLILTILIAYKTLSGREVQSGQDRYSVVLIDLFDTRTEITGYDTDEAEFTENARFITDELGYYNAIFDIYNDYDDVNNVKTINDNAGVSPVKVDEQLIDLIKFGKEMYYETDGEVNIAMGSVLSIWHTYREEGVADAENAKLPELSELEEANEHTNIENIIIDEENSTVYLADADMSLDVGGIAKGYAVQATADAAKEKGITNILMNVGGNICGIGTKEDGQNFKIGIQNPDLESDEPYIETVEISDGQCVVSSGDYQRYYEVDGEKYCHIIKPETLFPPKDFTQVSILTDDSGKADAYSTALFNMTLEEGQAFIKAHEGVEAMWVLADGSVYYSDGFK